MRVLPYLQKSLRYLLASSKFKQEDLDFLSLPLIHEIVYRIFSITTPLALVPAFFVSWQRHQMTVMAVQGVLAVVVTLHAWLLLKNNYRLLPPLMMFSVSIVLYVLAISRGEHFTLYWGSAFTVAFYLLAERSSARYLNAAWVVLNSALAVIIFPLEQAAYFVSSLVTTGFFVEILFMILSRNEEHLERLAERDPLTNAYNRRRMMLDMERAVEMRNRHNSPASIIIIDVDNFKFINDTFGHQEGDDVLKNLASSISARLRATDRLYRYGGEEFVVLLAASNLHQAALLAASLCELIRTMALSTKTAATISCGVAEVRNDDAVNDWIARGDTALYRAKNNGRDRVELEELPGKEFALSG